MQNVTDAAFGEAELRQLLRSLKRPDLSSVNPLGTRLCDALGTATPLQAMRQLVAMTFAPAGDAGARLADLITKSDIEAHFSHAGVAADMGLSTRQFFRYRARAVALLCRQIHLLLGGSLSPFNCLRTLADLLAETNPGNAAAIYDLMDGRHENEQLIRRMRLLVDAGADIPDAWVEQTPQPWRVLAELVQAHALTLNGNASEADAKVRRTRDAFVSGNQMSREIVTAIVSIDAVRARQRHDAERLRRIGRRLRTLAGTEQEPLARALLIEAEGALRSGNRSEAESIAKDVQRIARSNRDVRSVALLTLLSANLALTVNALTDADELATGAFFALQEQRPDAAVCQMTAARARLPLGKRWQMLPDYVLRPENAWDRIGLEIISARYLLRDAKFADAEELALRLAHLSITSGYEGLAAHALATLAACYGVARDDDAEQQTYIEAWGYYARCSDRLVGFDLFTPPIVRQRDLGPIALGEAFFEKISVHAKRTVPVLGMLENRELNRIWENGIAFANAASSVLPRSALARDGLDSETTLALREFVEQRCAGDLCSLLPYERRATWLERWHHYFSALRRI